MRVSVAAVVTHISVAAAAASGSDVAQLLPSFGSDMGARPALMVQQRDVLSQRRLMQAPGPVLFDPSASSPPSIDSGSGGTGGESGDGGDSGPASAPAQPGSRAARRSQQSSPLPVPSPIPRSPEDTFPPPPRRAQPQPDPSPAPAPEPPAPTPVSSQQVPAPQSPDLPSPGANDMREDEPPASSPTAPAPSRQATPASPPPLAPAPPEPTARAPSSPVASADTSAQAPTAQTAPAVAPAAPAVQSPATAALPAPTAQATAQAPVSSATIAAPMPASTGVLLMQGGWFIARAEGQAGCSCAGAHERLASLPTTMRAHHVPYLAQRLCSMLLRLIITSAHCTRVCPILTACTCMQLVHLSPRVPQMCARRPRLLPRRLWGLLPPLEAARAALVALQHQHLSLRTA